jgi:hypothetical protein
MISKIDEPFNYRFHGNFDTSSIAKRLSTYSEEWFENKDRQILYEVHKETNSIFVYDHANTWALGDNYDLKVNENQSVMIDLVSPIVKSLESIHDGKVGKCVFIKMPAHKSVGEHTDKMDYLGAVRRHHIAITTNDDVLFFVNKESKNMKVGECWEINNNLLHSVENNGDSERIHLMVDILPNKFIQGKK